jgi:hypothetical protein
MSAPRGRCYPPLAPGGRDRDICLQVGTAPPQPRTGGIGRLAGRARRGREETRGGRLMEVGAWSSREGRGRAARGSWHRMPACLHVPTHPPPETDPRTARSSAIQSQRIIASPLIMPRFGLRRDRSQATNARGRWQGGKGRGCRVARGDQKRRARRVRQGADVFFADGS